MMVPSELWRDLRFEANGRMQGQEEGEGGDRKAVVAGVVGGVNEVSDRCVVDICIVLLSLLIFSLYRCCRPLNEPTGILLTVAMD